MSRNPIRTLAIAASAALLAAAVAVPVMATEDVEKAACKDGAWQTLVDENGDAFKNQGQCVSHVAQGSNASDKPPEITYKSDSLGCTYSAWAYDQEDGVVPVSCHPLSALLEPSYWVGCSAEDSAGNVSEITFYFSCSPVLPPPIFP